MDTKSRNSMIDYLKALAVILVIVNHSLDDVARDTWPYFFLVRMSVPMFVLISGFNYTSSIERMDLPSCWFKRKHFIRKMATYLIPMFVVFLLWCVGEIAEGQLTMPSFAKAFVLQSYGFGAYYFWIIIQLYFMFPFVYHTIRKYNGKGYMIILLINIIYELVLYFCVIPMSVYRVIGIRYLMLLACGCWLHDCTIEDISHRISNSDSRKRNALLFLSFVAGCCYILFYGENWQNAEIFRYRTWGNTNVFICLYIVPIFYTILIRLKDRKIRIRWIHNLISTIGQSSYYILCTQLIMFWSITTIWEKISLPLFLQVILDVVIGVFTGILVNLVVRDLRRKKTVL